MDETLPMTSTSNSPSWRELVWPREHGSWSLALEPIALGLLVAPSWGGTALAVSAIAGFFSRRPLRTAVTDDRPERRAAARRALDSCGIVAALGGVAALAANGPAWLVWLVPTIVFGATFIFFDLRKAGRAELAEVAGAAAFGTLPPALAAAAGWSRTAALALGAVMLARSLPTVLTVRAALRARKEQASSTRLAITAAVLAAVAIAALVRAGLAPQAAFVFAAIFVARAAAWLVVPGIALRASTMGMIEAGLGIAFVAALAVAWRR